MKRTLSLLAAMLLLVTAFVTPAATTAAPSTSYYTVWENPGKTGDWWKIDRYADGNAPDFRNEFIGLNNGYCEGVHSPDYQTSSWNNCVDDGRVFLEHGECVRSYTGLYSGVIATHKADGPGDYYNNNIGTGHDTMSSVRWGDWDFFYDVCVFP